MRLTALFAALSLAAPALATSPEEDYGAARDKGIAAVKALQDSKADDPKVDAVDEAALAELQARLIPIVGPVSVKGFSKTAKINLETLSQQGMGVNLLDALAFAPTPDPKDGSILLATTRPLLEKWLKARAAESDAPSRSPTKPEEALRTGDFYSSAFESDAAFDWAGEVAIDKPAGADLAVAGLGERAQAEGPWPPSRLVVAVIKGDRVRIAEVATALKIPVYPACKTVWNKAEAKYQALMKAYAAGGAKDEKLDKASTAAEEDGYRAWLACEGDRAKHAPFYSGLNRQAQDLAERLAGG
jgi:hypothetical protein